MANKKIKMRLITIVLASLLSGCVADSAIKVVGTAPINSACQIQLVNDEGHIIVKRDVNGEFKTTLIWGTFAHFGELKVIGICNEKITKSVTEEHFPRQFSEELNVGDISP